MLLMMPSQICKPSVNGWDRLASPLSLTHLGRHIGIVLLEALSQALTR